MENPPLHLPLVGLTSCVNACCLHYKWFPEERDVLPPALLQTKHRLSVRFVLQAKVHGMLPIPTCVKQCCGWSIWTHGRLRQGLHAMGCTSPLASCDAMQVRVQHHLQHLEQDHTQLFSVSMVHLYPTAW